jgi:hypothetical protein
MPPNPEQLSIIYAAGLCFTDAEIRLQRVRSAEELLQGGGVPADIVEGVLLLDCAVSVQLRRLHIAFDLQPWPLRHG